MNAPSRHFEPATCLASQEPSIANASGTSMRWAALCEAGQVVAMMAGVEVEPPTREIRDFPASVGECEPWRRKLADNGCADLAAVMEPGLSALLAINARGADCRPAALALWNEFVAARSALLALLLSAGEREPREGAWRA